MHRNYEYELLNPMENELYTSFNYTRIKGLGYNGGNGTVLRWGVKTNL